MCHNPFFDVLLAIEEYEAISVQGDPKGLTSRNVKKLSNSFLGYCLVSFHFQCSILGGLPLHTTCEVFTSRTFAVLISISTPAPLRTAWAYVKITGIGVTLTRPSILKAVLRTTLPICPPVCAFGTRDIKSSVLLPSSCLCACRLANHMPELKLLLNSVAGAGFWAGYSIPLALPRIKSKLWQCKACPARLLNDPSSIFNAGI